LIREKEALAERGGKADGDNGHVGEKFIGTDHGGVLGRRERSKNPGIGTQMNFQALSARFISRVGRKDEGPRKEDSLRAGKPRA